MMMAHPSRPLWLCLAFIWMVAGVSGSLQYEPETLHHLLAVLPLAANSPAMDVMAIASAARARGHRVTVAVPASDLAFAKRAAGRHGGGRGADKLEYLVFDPPPAATTNDDDIQALARKVAKGQNPIAMISGLQKAFMRPCARMAGDADYLARVEAAGPYDGIVSFALPGDGADSCACLLSHLLRVPMVAVHSGALIGGPITTPQFGSGLTADELRTPLGFAKNLGYAAMVRGMMAVFVGVSRRSLAPARAALGIPLTGPARLGRTCAPALRLLAASWVLEPPRPIGPPNVIVGPIGARDAQPEPLEPANAAAFLDGALESNGGRGAVVVSFGSMAGFGTGLSRADYDGLSGAFTGLAPVRVLWLMKRASLPPNITLESLNLGANVLVVEWADVNDALGHPATRLFVSHGGIHSVYEAVHHGVAVAGAPIQFEQTANLKRLVALGLAELLPGAPALRRRGQAYERAAVGATLARLLEDPKYAAAASRARAAARMLSRARPALDASVAEIELCVATSGWGRYRPYEGRRAPGERGQGAQAQEEPFGSVVDEL